jgi:hypothetical protein
MKYAILCCSAVFAFVVVSVPVHAQSKDEWAYSCPPADLVQGVPAADQGGVPMEVALGACAVTGDLAGANTKDAVIAVTAEPIVSGAKVWGVAMVTLIDGVNVGFIFQTAQNNITHTGQPAYQITWGTGRMSGIKGSGVCAVIYLPNGGSNGSCTGLYTIP